MHWWNLEITWYANSINLEIIYLLSAQQFCHVCNLGQRKRPSFLRITLQIFVPNKACFLHKLHVLHTRVSYRFCRKKKSGRAGMHLQWARHPSLQQIEQTEAGIGWTHGQLAECMRVVKRGTMSVASEEQHSRVWRGGGGQHEDLSYFQVGLWPSTFW